MAIKLLPTASPESLGIPSGAVAAFLNELNASDFTMHSFLLLRHGKLAAEGYWKPFARDTKHLMYSVTKSFVSIAIGFLADEGKLSLDDHICDYFPEKEPENGFHPYTRMMTIHNLLTMSTVHEMTAWKQTGSSDWVGSFFALTPSHIPGTVFTYDTSATHTLAALIKKLSGENLLEYLKPRLLDPLGFAEDTFCWNDAEGIAQGGGGLNALPYDMAKFGLCLLQGGVFEGEQVIPAWYVAEATKKQVDNTLSRMRLEGQNGYGYFFWRTKHGGFTCYGMGGQFVFCLPEKDLVLVTTANALRYGDDHQRIFDLFWSELYPALADEALPEDAAAAAALQQQLDSLAIPTVQGSFANEKAAAWVGRTYRMNAGNSLGINEASLELTEAGGCYRFGCAEGNFALPFGFGRMQEGEAFPLNGHPCITSAAWQAENTLLITSHLLGDTVGTAELKLVFDVGAPDTLTIFSREYGAVGLKHFVGYASGSAN